MILKYGSKEEAMVVGPRESYGQKFHLSTIDYSVEVGVVVLVQGTTTVQNCENKKRWLEDTVNVP